MKKLYPIAWLCLMGISNIGYAQTVQVHIAGSDYLATFADTNLSAGSRERIAAELTTAYSLTTSPGKRKSMLFRDEEEGVVIVDKSNQKSIKIAKPLSDKYLRAFAWMDANSNTVQKAYEFVTLLNSPDLLSKPAQVLLNLEHFAPLSGITEDAPPSEAELRANCAEHIFPYKHLGISALRFYFRPIPEHDDVVIPQVILFVVDKTDPTEIGGVPIGFYKGKWGFGNFSEP